MTEQQLREKLQFAYGNMPDATRAAFEHSLTHRCAPETHRNIGLSRTMRIVITAVLMALMLTAVGVPGGVVDVNQPSICLYFAPCADLTSLRIVPEGEAGFTLNLSGEKGTE